MPGFVGATLAVARRGLVNSGWGQAPPLRNANSLSWIGLRWTQMARTGASPVPTITRLFSQPSDSRSYVNHDLAALSVQHGNLDATLTCNIGGTLVAGIDVAGDAHARVGGQDAFQTNGCFGRAIGHDDLAGMQAVADADADAVVEADPRWRRRRC